MIEPAGPMWPELVLPAVAAALLGGIGAVLRAFLSRWRGVLPWGTLTANTLAAAAIGLSLGIEADAAASVLIAAGFAGGLSTFSGVAKDCFDFYHRGRLAQLLLNGLANLAAPAAGLWIITAIG